MTDLYGAVTGTDDARTVRFERDCAATPEDLWSAITTREQLGDWLDNVDGDLREGGSVVVHFDDGDSTFVVEACTPPSTLTVRWVGTGGSTGDSTVHVEITAPEPGRSRLVLVHDGLGATASDYATGWHSHLDALVALLEDQDVDPTDWDELAEHYRQGPADA